MKIPYGIADFKILREENYLYIDKTNYIATLENSSSRYLFFIRPRRFGKSLFLSTLAHYYDINMEAEFENLFGDLYIGKNPTLLRNSYMVLKLNFSGLNTNSKLELEESFKNSLRLAIKTFLSKYNNFFKDIGILEDKIERFKDVRSIIELLIEEVKKIDKKIYLIIDEYDHFANDIIAMGESELYKDIVHASGFVRDFYETVKIGTEGGIDRIFITGISPILLDDLTSGFNISENITMDETLNEMLGFTHKELQGIIQKLGIKQEDIKIKLEEYYNGYLFNIDCCERVYNPDMILYYFNKFMKTRKQPRELIDDNVKTDYGRLGRLVVNKRNRNMLESIVKEESITAGIVTKFSFDSMYDDKYFVSLLFYMGMLTIRGMKYGTYELTIPNYVIKTVFWEYFENELRKEYNIDYKTESLAKSIWQMGFEGKIEPFMEFIGTNVLKQLSNRDLIEFDEKYIKVILFSYLITNSMYRPISEMEVENGYVDIYLERDVRMPDVKYEWLIELKYVKKADKDTLQQVKEEGLRQLERYGASRGVDGREDVKKVLLIFVGKDEVEVVGSK